MIKNSKILIVDDEPRLCDSLETLLCAQNYDVKTCNSGNEALPFLTSNEFDLVLLDIFMDGMDGFQVIEKIMHQKIDTPVIIMTGNASTESAVKALRMGARDYLKKPFETGELFSSVRNTLNLRQLKKENELMTRKLKESVQRFRNLTESTSDWIWEVDLKGLYTYCSPKINGLLGYKPEELIGKTPFDLMPAGEAKRVSDLFNTFVSSQSSFDSIENVNIHKNGSHVVMETSGVPFLSDEGELLGYRGIDRDITERKLIEFALKEQTRTLNGILKNAGDGICVCHNIAEWPNVKFTHWNPRMTFITGYTIEEINQLGWFQAMYTDPEVQQKAIERMAKMRQGDDIRAEEWVITAKGGNKKTLSISTTILKKEGDKTYVLGVMQDITNRKLAEKALEESKQRFRTVANFAYDLEYWISPDGSPIYTSPSCKKITGYGPDDFRNNPGLMIEIIHPDDRATFTKHKHIVDESGETFPMDFRIITKDGNERLIEHVCQAVYDMDGQHLGQRGSIRDITAQKKLQEEVLKARKLESIGTLAGGIAHDLNNLLYVVMGNISLAQNDLKLEIEMSESLKEAQKACIKAKELSARLITFSKGGDPIKKINSIDDLLKKTVATALSGSNIKPEMSISEDIRQVNIDKGQIKQVVHNIVVNARETMDDKGQLKVSCENIDIAEDGYLTLSQGDYIKISFKDHGCGISKKNLEKIFDPYFSTKDRGVDKGQGLGLAVSYSIVQKHGGLITLESEMETGSTFSVFLPGLSVKEPDLQKSEEKPAAQKPVKQPATGTGKILLMDDEQAIRAFLSRVINRLGYAVETCTEGKEVIEIYKKAMESKEPFDVVILDLTNKIGMGGQETMKRLLELDHDANGIVITGYCDDPVVANFRAYGFSGYLTKPTTMDELSKVINEVLSEDQ
jgi:PAS domain S-box-containing protein